MTAIPASVSSDPSVLHWMPPAQLVLHEQVRKVFDPKALAGLADNIRQHGVLQPVICFLQEGKVVVLDGERHVRASILAALARVPVRLLVDPLDVAKVRARQLAANLQRENLNPVEQAEGIQAFMDGSGLTAEQAAAELGLSTSKVSRTLAINRLGPEHKELVAAGKLSAEAACLLTRVGDPAARESLAKQSCDGLLTRDALAAEVRSWEAARSAPPSARPGETNQTAARTKPRVAVWRMTRSIGLGVALAITGTGLTLQELVSLLDAFIARAREAMARNTPIARFLSEFRYDGPAVKGATP